MTAEPIPQADPRAGYRAQRDDIDRAVLDALGSGRYILGERVAEFEEAFAARFGGRHAVGVANGTDAVELALRGLGVGPGGLVFAPSHTAVATVAAIARCGATPVLVDSDPHRGLIDPASLGEALDAARRGAYEGKPAAIIAVHLYGHPAPLPELLRLAGDQRLPLVEDCAQAHGATLHGRPAGTWGAAGTFSFYPTKNLGAFGDGGAILLEDAALSGRIRALRQYGWDAARDSRMVGLNSRLDEVQAAILLVRLAHFDQDQARRRAIAAAYNVGLAGTGLVLPAPAAGALHAWHQYVVQSERRDAFREHLAARGVQSAVHYPLAVHQQGAYRGRVALAPGGLAKTEELCRRILSLPMFPQLDDEQVARIVAAVRSWAGA